jgi:oligoendopeptidase F
MAEIQILENAYNQLSVYDDYFETYDEIYSELLARRIIAAELAGYNSFPEYSFSDWSVSVEDVGAFIENVKQTILPVYQKLIDNNYNPCPAAGFIKPAYSNRNLEYALSMQILRSSMAEMDALVEFTERNRMLDIKTRPGKNSGAFVAPLYGVQVPFVYMEYPYADVVFHEFGHALEVFMWPKIDLTHRIAFTPESAEVASMCMEVLATSGYEFLYGNTAEHAKTAKKYDMVKVLLEQTMLCEFELTLYANPHMSMDERISLFNRLLREYRIDEYDWVIVHHLFINPLYTISYSINTIVALEFWQLMQENPAYAKEVYLSYLSDSTQSDFVMRLENAGLSNPYDREKLAELAKWLDEFFSSEAYRNP